MNTNVKEIRAALENLLTGKGVYPDPLFLKEDGSLVDNDRAEVYKANPFGEEAFDNFSGFTPNSAPTADVRGGVYLGSSVADSTAEELSALVTDFNALLASLRASGVIATPPEPEE